MLRTAPIYPNVQAFGNGPYNSHSQLQPQMMPGLYKPINPYCINGGIFFSFNDTLFPENCTPERFENICSRMVSVEIEFKDMDYVYFVYKKFSEIGNIEKSKLSSRDDLLTLKIVYEEIESIFKLLRHQDFKIFDYFAHVMELDMQNDDLEMPYYGSVVGSEITIGEELGVEEAGSCAEGKAACSLLPLDHREENLRFNFRAGQ